MDLSILTNHSPKPCPPELPPVRNGPTSPTFLTYLRSLGEKSVTRESRPEEAKPAREDEKPPEAEGTEEKDPQESAPVQVGFQPSPPKDEAPAQTGGPVIEAEDGSQSVEAVGAVSGEGIVTALSGELAAGVQLAGGVPEEGITKQSVPEESPAGANTLSGVLPVEGAETPGEVVEPVVTLPETGKGDPARAGPEVPHSPVKGSDGSQGAVLSDLDGSFSPGEGGTSAGEGAQEVLEAGLQVENGNGESDQAFSAALNGLEGGRAAPASAARPVAENLSQLVSSSLIEPVSQAVAGLSKGKHATLVLELNPPELGKIDLQVTTETNGTRIALVADTHATGLLLESHVAGLRKSLADMGVNLLGLSIGFGGGNQKPADRRGEFQASRRSHPASEPATRLLEVPLDTAYRLQGGQALHIDYRV